jgi:predicted Zn finger-like uncharacterized protein
MSLVTRCPACTTTFKVVRDQLRISDGWVRCGRCSHVFDATLDLHEAPEGAPATGSPQPVQGGYMPGLVEPSAAPKTPERVSVPAAPTAPPSPPAEVPGDVLTETLADAPASSTEDADFFDDEPEPQPHEASEASSVPEPAPPPPSPPPAPAPSAFSLSLPEHGLIADEPWSDLDTTEPAWKPPPSTLPPFPNIDLNLASPPPAAAPPAPPLPFAPRMLKTRAALIERASEDGEGEREQEEKDHDQVQMQKALRRARAKSAKIAGAKAREERAAAKAAEASVVQVRSEPDYSLSSTFEPPVGHPLAEEDDAADAALRGDAPGFWQRRGVRAVMVLLAVIALVLLALQVLRHERDGIAARQPSLRPALAMLCQYTGCELAALRQIGDIVIEGAAFAREKTGTNDYRLSFTLRNGATVPLAMPAVELSLLDTQERAVVRRVLLPPDYGAPSVLQARADRAASLPLTLSASEAAALPPIAGYRVEAFYP